jgi:alpha-N-arabinofuranosidase
VSVDLNADLSPISPRIYGQFIEHMGNCIYNGIWAEMLQDRKFFHPVAGAAGKDAAESPSPWSGFGGGGSFDVGMDEREPYAGRRSVALGCEAGAWAGIRHGGLALCAGRAYAGRIVARKTSGAPAALEARLVWGEGEDERAVAVFPLKDAWTAHKFEVAARRGAARGALEILLRGGAARIGAVSLMPADNVHGFRPDTLALLAALDAPVYRWPGGNFVSGHDWWDAIGDPDKRAPVKNPSWPGIEHHDVGIDEFMTFCRTLRTEPYVVVNAGLGTSEMAAALVEYANGDADTQWGRRRAENGRARPYRVKWWGIGNEMYGDWQHGNVPLERYIERHKAFAAAMRAVDPSIQIVGVGATGAWSRGMLEGCGGDMTLLSEHFYCATHADTLRHVLSMRDAVRDKAERHLETCRAVFGAARARVPLALDEWNYAWGDAPHVYGDYGVRYAWRDGLGVAAGLCEMIRWRRVFAMANFAQTVNVIGAIKTTATAAAFEPCALPLIMFRHGFGALGADVTGDPAPLEVVCGVTVDKTWLTLAVVNPTPAWRRLAIELRGNEFSGEGSLCLCAHPDPGARNAPGACEAADAAQGVGEAAVGIETPPWLGFDPRAVPAPPYSVALWRLELGAPRASRPAPIEDLAPVPPGARRLMLFARGGALHGAASDDGLVWRELGGGAELGGKVGGISACRGANGYALVIARGGALLAAETEDFVRLGPFKEVAPEGPPLGEVCDPCIGFAPEERRYELFFGHRLGRARICAARSADLAAWTAPEVVLARGGDVRGPALLRGARNFLWYEDGNVRTCRMALGRGPAASYVSASAPLGALGTRAPRVLFDGTRVFLYLARAEGGAQVLASRDLRCWEEVPAEQVALPEGMDAFCVLWADEKTVAGFK